MAVKEKMRIRLKGYDHNLVDKAAERIVETAKRTGVQVSGPVPLPTEKEIVTILRAVHKYKDSREQFEQRTHKRLIDIIRPSAKTAEALTNLELPAGATGGTSAPLLTAPSFAFAAGKGVRVTEADTLDISTFGPSKTLVSSSTALAALPSLALVAADGTPLANDGKWILYLTNGGKTLKFGPVRGTKILLR